MILPYGTDEIDYDELKKYYYCTEFPHICLDHTFNPVRLTQVANDFPKPTDGNWWKYENVLEKKLARNDLENLPKSIQNLISELQSQIFVSFLEKVTGIENLIIDPSLNGGGLHQIIRGGKLDIHADYNYHPETKLDRRLNVLVYLNDAWQGDWGGYLEFWDKTMENCIRRISPVFNRMVIFNVNDWAYHGHPDPLNCPEGQTRKSIALYYYTRGRPEHERTEPHSTIFKRRPQDPIVQEYEELRQKRAVRRLT